MIIKPEYIHEFALRDVCRCPLRRPDPCGPTASPLEIAVERTLRENLFLAFADEFLSRKHIRDRLERAVQDAGDKNPDWQRLPAIAERLDQITMRYRVLSPLTPYRLATAGAEVRGEYAILQRCGVKNEILVLRLRGLENEHRQFKGFKRYEPDIVCCARLVHLINSEPKFRRFAVLNFHMSRDIAWRDLIDPGLARRSVEGAMRMWREGLIFPAPGYHCRDCSTHGCRKLHTPRAA